MAETAFSAPGRFWKGNLHAHSNRSDGALDPAEVCGRYEQAGYDFLAVTDHFLEIYGYPITDTAACAGSGFTTIPGAELHTGTQENGELWHILAVGLPADFPRPRAPHFRPVEGSESGAELALRARQAGAFVAIAHPEWNGLSMADARTITAAHAVEIYNHTCAVQSDRARGFHILDRLLSEGRHLSLCATDDAHFNQDDGMGGWVMVKAPTNTPEALLTALKRGHYYSSTGAELLDVTWEDRFVRVSCAPASDIIVVGAGSAADSRHGNGLTGADIRLDLFDASPWMRVAVRNAQGGMAWSQPHFRPPLV